ncbi:hypothetical protein QR680_018843 [Steinernema hermaphroditum]|uniref:EB domain-containing protein n=1 Tax=Steinernema hermaphroditum TaxID=289476 RepID=A0AA39LRG0_9BILA|nr:hypothetical protein QR680_018843 [Steinernema hermaphroditum]
MCNSFLSPQSSSTPQLADPPLMIPVDRSSIHIDQMPHRPTATKFVLPLLLLLRSVSIYALYGKPLPSRPDCPTYAPYYISEGRTLNEEGTCNLVNLCRMDEKTIYQPCKSHDQCGGLDICYHGKCRCDQSNGLGQGRPHVPEALRLCKNAWCSGCCSKAPCGGTSPGPAPEVFFESLQRSEGGGAEAAASIVPPFTLFLQTPSWRRVPSASRRSKGTHIDPKTKRETSPGETSGSASGGSGYARGLPRLQARVDASRMLYGNYVYGIGTLDSAFDGSLDRRSPPT